MAYSVDTYSGSKTFVVEDGTIDSSLDILLVGKNYSGYGELQNENFLHLLENFAGSTAPPRPLTGQLWYDSLSRKVKFWDSASATWRSSGAAEVSTTAPTGLTVGDLWWDQVNNQLYGFDGSTFILVGPQGIPGLGTTQFKSMSVTDIYGNIHPIMSAYVGGSIVLVISNDIEYELSTISKTALGGAPAFRKIKPGINLVNTSNDLEPGVTQGTASLNDPDGKIFWGTVSNSLQLNGFGSDDFLKTDIDLTNFSTKIRFADAGFTLGNSEDLAVLIDANGVTPLYRSTTGDTLKFQTWISGSSYHTPLSLVGSDILPGNDNTTAVGSTALRFKEVHATRFYGIGTNLSALNASSLSSGSVPVDRLSGTYSIDISGTSSFTDSSNNLLVGASYKTASISVIPGTIAARTEDPEVVSGITIDPGSIKANYFVGTATSALFADLAEKYLADRKYEAGTVVMIGGTSEVTACTLGSIALGAVSTSPAYMMNTGLVGGTFIALKGRVPVKVIGMIKKGEGLVASNDGCAERSTENSRIFAISMEDNFDLGVKLVEAVIL